MSLDIREQVESTDAAEKEETPVTAVDTTTEADETTELVVSPLEVPLDEEKDSDTKEPSPPPRFIGTEPTACMRHLAEHFGLVVTDRTLSVGQSNNVDEMFRVQADNIGLSMTPRTGYGKVRNEDLPCIAQCQAGDFVVLEKLDGQDMVLWDGHKRIVQNRRDIWDDLNNRIWTFSMVFETDKLEFLSQSWFFGQVKRMWPLYWQVVFASIFIHCFTLVIPLLMGIFYDRILPNLAESSLRVLITGAVIVLFLDFVLKNIRASLVEKAALRIERDAEPYLLGQLLDVVLTALPSSSGHLTHAVQEFSRIKSLFTTQLVLGIIDFFFLFFFLFVIFLNSGMLVVVPAVISLLVLIVAVTFGILIDKNVSSQSNLQSRKSSFLNEVFAGIEAIKVSNASRIFKARWATEVEKSGEMASMYRLAQSRCSMMTGFLGQLNSAGLLVVAFFLIGSGSMTSGGLLATMVLSGRCIAVSASMTNLITTYLFAKRSYVDLRDLLSLEKENSEQKQYKVERLNGNLTFDSVSFRYFPESPFVLENVSFKIKAREKVGIIGPMGSGKSTLLKLIAGLAMPSEGVILLDEQNMAFLNLERVREHMGVVPQSPVLFYGTLEFNLLMGASKVTQESFSRALNVAGLTSFVSSHPLGLKMQILESGNNLSRGQRQSVAIARSIVDDPTLLLLDEPTSSMDSVQEKNFIVQMQQSMKDKTVVVVTHKPSVLQMVDRIMVVDGGRIVADGPKQTILKKLSEKQS